MVTQKQFQTFLLIVLALNIVGILLLLLLPFGGMTVATSYGPRDRFASLGSEYSEVSDNLFIAVIAVCLIVTAAISALKLRGKGFSDAKSVNRMALLFSIGAVAATIIGAVSYEIIRAAIDYLDWWLDTGFYAALIAGLANLVFYVSVLRKPAQMD